MNKVILYIATSLDGFIADHQGGVDWLPHPNDPEDLLGFKALMERISGIVMGSKSYKQILSFGAWAWPHKKTYVFTSQNLTTEQSCIEFVKDNPQTFMEKEVITQKTKNLWLLGGATLARSFAEAKLVDEVIMSIIPIHLEKGIALELPWNDFIITNTKPCMDGIVQNKYEKKKV